MFLPLVERRDGQFLTSAATAAQFVDLGAVQVTQTVAHTAADRPSQGYRDPGNMMAWAFVTRGSIVVRQSHATLETIPGTMSAKYMQRETDFRYTPDFRSLSIRLQADAIGLSPRQKDAVTGEVFGLDNGASRLMWSVVAHALRHSATLTAGTSAAMARSVIDFTSAFVDEYVGRFTAPEIEHRNLVVEALRHIDIHAAQPRLTPADVADGVRVSLRRLQKAFQAESRSVAGSILTARLDRAAALLIDSPPGTTIEQVAERSGFKSPAHFSRAFRARYDHSPREWRLLQRASSTALDLARTSP